MFSYLIDIFFINKAGIYATAVAVFLQGSVFCLLFCDPAGFIIGFGYHNFCDHHIEMDVDSISFHGMVV